MGAGVEISRVESALSDKSSCAVLAVSAGVQLN